MNVKFSAKVRNICEMKCIFAPRFVPTWGFILHFGLKGNRVRVPDSPAAVTFSRGLLNNVRTGIKPAPTEMPLLNNSGQPQGVAPTDWMGRRAIEGSQKTCKTTYTWHLRGEECRTTFPFSFSSTLTLRFRFRFCYPPCLGVLIKFLFTRQDEL